MYEMVDHPAHYNIAGKKECIEQMREDYGNVVTMIFCLTSAYKYLYRVGTKPDNSQEQDIAKARWYFSYIKPYLAELGNEYEEFWKLYKNVKEMLYEYM